MALINVTKIKWYEATRCWRLVAPSDSSTWPPCCVPDKGWAVSALSCMCVWGCVFLHACICMRERMWVGSLLVGVVCVQFVWKMNVLWRSRDNKSISDEGVQRVIFSNTGYHSHYVLMSRTDTWQSTNGISLRVKIPLWLVGGFWASHCLKWRQKENVGESLFLAQVLKARAIMLYLFLTVGFLPSECDGIL